MADQLSLSMMRPSVENLLDVVDSKFTLISISARRARQINAYFSRLGEGIGSIVPPQVDSISKKPLTVAFEEISAGKITYSRPDANGPRMTVDDNGVQKMRAPIEPVQIEESETELDESADE